MMLASCLSLGWALWRDAFKPEVFLAGLVAFSWGYILLWRHDVSVRLAVLEAEVAELKSRLDIPGDEVESLVWTQELPEAAKPPDACADPNGAANETPSEARDEAEAQGPVGF